MILWWRKKTSSGKWKRMKLDQRVGVFLEHRPRERAQIAKWNRAQMETVLQCLKQPICNNQLFSCPSLPEKPVNKHKAKKLLKALTFQSSLRSAMKARNAMWWTWQMFVPADVLRRTNANTRTWFTTHYIFGNKLKWLSELEQERLRSSWLSWLSTQELSWRPLKASSHGRSRELKTIHCMLQNRLGAASGPSICAHSQRSSPTNFTAEALPRAAS